MSWLRGGGVKIAGVAVLALLIVVIAFSFRGKKSAPPQPPSGATTLSVRVHTSPPGATIRINNEVKGVSDLQLDLPPGNYQVEAQLAGFKSATATLEAKSGNSNSIELTLQPSPPELRVSSDTGAGKVMVDDSPAVDLAGEERRIGDLAAGNHNLKFEGPQGTASFAFATDTKAPPSVVGAITTNKIVAIVVGNLGPKVQIHCSETSAEVRLDDSSPAKLSAGSVDITDISPGTHQLLIKTATDQYKMPIEVGPASTLNVFLQSGKNVGTLLVMTGEDGVKVSVNGVPQKATTRGGQLRIPNLDPKEYTIAVSKPGYQILAPQKAVVRKGELSAVLFAMTPFPRVASLSIRGGSPGTQVLVDDQPAGTVQSDGSLSVGNISPGSHTIVLRKDRFESKRLAKNFVAGQETLISGSDANLQAANGTVKITFTPPDAQVTITNPSGPPTKVSSGSILILPPGTYSIVAKTSDEMSRTKNIEVFAGQNLSVDLPLAPSGMSKWDDPSGWKSEQNAYVHRGGGFVLFGTSPTSGTFSFSVELQKGKRIQWFLNYTDPGNYVLFQMDENYFYRSTMRNGAETDQAKVPHKIQKKAFQTLRIKVSSSEIVHQIKDGDSWMVLDKWTSPGTNLSLGRFGFYLPGKDQVAIMNFNHYPDMESR